MPSLINGFHITYYDTSEEKFWEHVRTEIIKVVDDFNKNNT